MCRSNFGSKQIHERMYVENNAIWYAITLLTQLYMRRMSWYVLSENCILRNVATWRFDAKTSNVIWLGYSRILNAIFLINNAYFSNRFSVQVSEKCKLGKNEKISKSKILSLRSVFPEPGSIMKISCLRLIICLTNIQEISDLNIFRDKWV